MPYFYEALKPELADEGISSVWQLQIHSQPLSGVIIVRGIILLDSVS